MIAEALAAETKAGDGEDGDEDGGGLDLLDVLEGMCAHFHEHHDAVLAWPWPLFCAKWIRLLRASAQEREREERRKLEAEQRELMGR